jgi:hypothetical protein
MGGNVQPSMLFFAILDQRWYYYTRLRSGHFSWYATVWITSRKYLLKTIKYDVIALKARECFELVTRDR